MDKSSQKIIIGFDLDGVIIDHTANKIRLAKEAGWELEVKQTPGDIIKTIIPQAVLTGLQWKLYYQPETAFSAPLMPGALRALEQIKKNGKPYYLVSRRKIPEMAVWLLKFHGLWPQFFNKRNTFFVEGVEDKNQQAKKLGITHYVDDEPSVLGKLTEVENKILFDRHRVFKKATGFVKVASWLDLGKKLKLF